MSKFIFVKYREKQDSDKIKGNLKQLCDRLSPRGLKMEHLVYENKLCKHSFIGIQNALDAREESTCLLLGHLDSDLHQFDKIGDPLPDGSYSLIRFNEHYIEFFCDKFCSRTLWYYFDEKKIIISNSQRAIVSLKEEFKLNKTTVSWFLSSGSLGPFLSWDEDIEMIKPDDFVQLSIANWEILKPPTEYLFEKELASFKGKDYETYYAEYTKESLKRITGKFKIKNLLLPLSGGQDSRFLLYITREVERLSKITVINWGKKQDNTFDDKTAAKAVAKHYKLNLLDRYLPETVGDHKCFLEKFINLGDCRIDHFEAYTDNFALWGDLYKDGFKMLIRGDIPFIEGLDLNERMARSRIGMNQFIDYSNVEDYKFGSLLLLQKEVKGIARENGESLIQWRDRLYTNYNMPMVIASFSDLINAYLENRSPMISGALYLNYSKLKAKHKGDKKHLVRLNQKLDKSGVPFHATPSIPSKIGVFKNKKGIHFLINYIKEINREEVFEASLINSVLQHLSSVKAKKHKHKSLSEKAKEYLSANLPPYLKAYLKSKAKLYLDPITVAYRIVMIDLAVKMYKEEANYLKNHDD